MNDLAKKLLEGVDNEIAWQIAKATDNGYGNISAESIVAIGDRYPGRSEKVVLHISKNGMPLASIFDPNTGLIVSGGRAPTLNDLNACGMKLVFQPKN